MTSVAAWLALLAACVTQADNDTAAIQPVSSGFSDPSCQTPEPSCQIPAPIYAAPTCALPAGCGMSESGVYGDPCNLACFQGGSNDCWCDGVYDGAGGHHGRGCRCGYCGHGCCLCGIRLMTTGDLIPHYPYLPAYHGYYYFRPYNYVHVEQHKQLAAMMGGDYRAPYQTLMFQPIYANFSPMEYVNRDLDVPKVPARPSVTTLPKLESFLIPAE